MFQVLPRNSNFPSPLTLLDAVRDEEENPIGLTIWNMSIATFQATFKALKKTLKKALKAFKGC